MSNQAALSRVRVLSALVAASSLLAACGGGGSSSQPPPPPPPPPPPSSVSITGKAVDGALQGATACYDVNDNKVCETAEPTSGASDAGGNFTITNVLETDAGKHRVIVNVPATAIDADTGAAVGKAFTLIAPATGAAGAQSVFVSPLTNLVQQQIDATGQTRTEATTFIQGQLGLTVSPLADFTASASAANTTAANAARLVIKAQDQAATSVAAAVGQTDLSGGTVTQADVDKAVAKAVASALPAIGASAADPALAGLTGAPLQTALNTAAATVVTGTGVSASAVVVAVGIAKLPVDATATTPEAGAALAALQYTDANNWFMRVNQSSALDNTPDANGLLRFYDLRTRMQPYAYQPTVGVAESFAQVNSKDRIGDLHWNGSAWVACTLGMRNTSTQRDTQGRSSYNVCDNSGKGITTRAALDIAGQTMATVVAEKILPVVGTGTYTGGGGGNGWNLNMAALGATAFPAGSKLFLQSDVTTETAPSYPVRAVDVVNVFSAAVAAGGDGRVAGTACATAGTAVASLNLEEVAARNPGVPCIFNVQTNADGTSTSPRESWGLNTISMGDVPNYFTTLPAGTANYYSNTGRMRVAFSATGNATTYYQCYARRSDNSVQNCTAIGTGTYSLTALGDARVMSFNNVPAPIQRVTFSRLFVERGGKVYFGFKNPMGATTNNVRLNLVAAQAMLTQLGLPRILPADAPKPLTGERATAMATAKGVWGVSDGTDALVLRVGDNGRYLVVEVGAAGGGGNSGLELGWFDFAPSTTQLGRLIEIDTNGQWGLSHVQPNEGFASITSTAITTKGNEVFNRLPDSGTGIVGMWAVGSATDLKAPQFVFFAPVNGVSRVLSIHPYAASTAACVTSTQNFGPPGIEWADYTYNAATGALQILNKLLDSTGCTGFFDSASATPNTLTDIALTIAADGLTASAVTPIGTFTLYRILPQ